MKIAVFAVCALLTGCVSDNTMLRNKDGQVIRCSYQGWGWIGAPVAAAEHSSCVKKANAAGYYEMGQPVPTAPNASDIATAAGAGILQGAAGAVGH